MRARCHPDDAVRKRSDWASARDSAEVDAFFRPLASNSPASQALRAQRQSPPPWPSAGLTLEVKDQPARPARARWGLPAKPLVPLPLPFQSQEGPFDSSLPSESTFVRPVPLARVTQSQVNGEVRNVEIRNLETENKALWNLAVRQHKIISGLTRPQRLS